MSFRISGIDETVRRSIGRIRFEGYAELVEFEPNPKEPSDPQEPGDFEPVEPQEPEPTKPEDQDVKEPDVPIIKPGPGRNPERLIGMNAGWISDFSRWRIFRNLLRGSVVWLTSYANRNSTDINLATTDQVAGSFGGVYFWPVDSTTEYEIRIRKKSDYEQPGTATVTVQNASQTTFTSDGTFTISQARIDATGGNGNSEVRIVSIDNDTQVDVYLKSEAPPPGVDVDSPEWRFDPTYVELMKPADVIRFMDTLRINRNNSSKAVIDSATKLTNKDRVCQASIPFGCAIEHCLDLARLCNADAWIPFPHTSDQTIVDDWCGKIKAWLLANPKYKVYIEYSNELWNTQFWQTTIFNSSEPLYPHCMRQVGAALWPSDPSWIQEQKAAGKKAGEFFLMVENVLTTSEYVQVVSNHAAIGGSPNIDDFFTEFESAYGGPPKDLIAIADYLTWKEPHRNGIVDEAIRSVTGETVGNESELSELSASDLDQVDDYLVANYNAEWMLNYFRTDSDAGIELTKSWIDKWKLECDAYPGVKLARYEGGQHLAPSFNHADYLPKWMGEYERAQTLPGMFELLTEYFQAFYDTSKLPISQRGPQCYFTLAQEPKDGTTFGYLHQTVPSPDLDNPKWQAYERFVKANPHNEYA